MRRLTAILALSLPVSAAAQEREPSNWALFGSVLFQGEYRNSTNNFGGFGSHRRDAFAEVDARFERQFSPYSSVSGSFFGSYDESEFRGTRDGLAAERFYLKAEQGDVGAPWRLELGDFFGFTTLRTLQAPLKGGRFEYQVASDGGLFQSGQFFAGSRVSDYHQFAGAEFDDNLHAGYSHLIEMEKGSLLLSASWTHNEARGLTADAGLFSIAGERSFLVLDQFLTVESEVSMLGGETITNGAVTNDASMGYFGQLSGSGGAGWSYALRGEHYERNYKPIGSSITADRLFLEARLSKRFANGIDAELRAQQFEDNYSTTNVVTTQTVGLQTSWVNVPLRGNPSATLGFFWRDVVSENRAVENETLSADSSVSWSITPLWTTTTRLSALDLNSPQPTLSDQRTGQIDLSLNRRFDFTSVTGTFSPGFIVRRETTPTSSNWSYGPRLILSLFQQDGHSLNLNASSLWRDTGGGSTDTLGINGGLRYAYTKGNHRFGIEADYFSNDPDPGRKGEAYRIAANYTWRFAVPKPAANTANDGGSRFVSFRPGTLFRKGFPDIAALAPGTPLDASLEKFGEEGLGNGTEIGPNRIFEGRFLRGLGQRQRLVLTESADRLTKATIIIEFAPGRDAAGKAQEYARILERLGARYGTPERSIDDGVFVADLETALAAGRLRRITEWRLRTGILRFGVPARLDGVARMEIQFARIHPNVGDSFWSLEEVR